MNFSYQNIDTAHSQIKNQIIQTPLISNDYINKKLNSKVLFKLENLQNTGSFKLRGASYKISKISEENKKNGVVAYSSGNHAQAVAYASLKQKINCKIIMPKNAPTIKIENTKKSLNSGKILSNEKGHQSICDAIITPQPGNLTFPINLKNLEDGIVVNDDEVKNSIKILAEHLKIIVEPGGAVAATAALTEKIDLKNKTVVVMISGGNIDLEMFRSL